MNLHLYKVFDLTDINERGESPMDCCRVMTEKDLRREFLLAYNEGGIPQDLLSDFKQDSDYKDENWNDIGNLRVGTMIDMLNEIDNYVPGVGYYITETDVEVELNPAMVDRWLDVLNYWDDEVREAAERINKMPMYNEYDMVINDIYRMKKGV